MRTLKIITNRKIRNLSWKLRPAIMLALDETVLMPSILGACIFGLFLEAL